MLAFLPTDVSEGIWEDGNGSGTKDRSWGECWIAPLLRPHFETMKSADAFEDKFEEGKEGAKDVDRE